MAKDQIADVFSSLDKLNPEATYLSENALSNVDTWYDTGCYALNAIIGGRCVGGGVPKANASIGGTATRGEKAVLVRRP